MKKYNEGKGVSREILRKRMTARGLGWKNERNRMNARESEED